MSAPTFQIGGRAVGPGAPVFLIAELSANHNQDLSVGLETVRAAAASGADAIKLQTVNPDLITLDCDSEIFRIRDSNLWDGKTLHQLERETCLPREWHEPLIAEAKRAGLICFSSPFDLEAVDFLESLAMPAYKIASFEITDLALVSKAASTGKPIILSTGIATPTEIAEAVEACRRVGNNQIALLKCTSAYPTPMEDVHLRALPLLASRFGVLSGLSDHTLGDTVALGAVALGGCIIEKHFILDRSIPSADAAFSMEPAEFKAMATRIRELESALGTASLELTPAMQRGRAFARSLFFVEDVSEGEVITNRHVRSIRPGLGLMPKHLDEVLGRKAARAIRRGTPVAWDLLA